MDIKIKKSGAGFKGIFLIFAERSFLLSLSLILLSLLIGGLIFYEYYIQVINKDPEVSEVTLKINNQAYQDIISAWEERQKKLDEVDLKNYLNPFWTVGTTTE